MPGNNDRICASCGHRDPTGTIRNCRDCRMAYYCNVECQRSHWPTHKTRCRQVRAARQQGRHKVFRGRERHEELKAMWPMILAHAAGCWGRQLAGVNQDRLNIVWLAMLLDREWNVQLLVGDHRIREVFADDGILQTVQTNCCDHNSNDGNTLSFLAVIMRTELDSNLIPLFINKSNM